MFMRHVLNRSLSYAKIVQTECKDASLLASFAEVQPILCKDRDFHAIAQRLIIEKDGNSWE